MKDLIITLEDLKKGVDPINKIINANTLDALKLLPDDFVDTIITSPPYWGLRDYLIEEQIGLEATLEEYLEKLLAITSELKRVLKPTGVMFWNHGDSYSGGNAPFSKSSIVKAHILKRPGIRQISHIPIKSLYLQNYRLILRMIDEQGWILRNIIIWQKPNHMPSCLDPKTEVYIKNKERVRIMNLGKLYDEGIEDKGILTPTGWKKIKNIWKIKKDK